MELISVSGQAIGAFVSVKLLFFLIVPVVRGPGVPLPDEAVGGGEDPVPMNEGTPTGVEEGGLWAAPGPDLQ